jgi:hypothetical protein
MEAQRGLVAGLLRLAIEHGATNPPGKSQIHGERHWKAVALTGLWLADRTPGADRAFICTFAVLHDICRRHDGSDPEHGWRASVLYERITADPDPDLAYAIGAHTEGTTACDWPNVNVGICWDADRLCLPRVGITPDDSLLTTELARSLSAKRLGRALSRRPTVRKPLPSWEEIECASKRSTPQS